MFAEQIAFLTGADSPLLKLDQRNKTAISNYQNWKKVVSSNLNEVLEFRRLVNDANGVEQNIAERQRNLQQMEDELATAVSTKDTLQEENDEIRQLLDESKRWAEAGSRLATKRAQVNEKQEDLTMTSGDSQGRDIKTVERELQERMKKKDDYGTKVRLQACFICRRRNPM